MRTMFLLRLEHGQLQDQGKLPLSENLLQMYKWLQAVILILLMSKCVPKRYLNKTALIQSPRPIRPATERVHFPKN